MQSLVKHVKQYPSYSYRVEHPKKDPEMQPLMFRNRRLCTLAGVDNNVNTYIILWVKVVVLGIAQNFFLRGQPPYSPGETKWLVPTSCPLFGGFTDCSATIIMSDSMQWWTPRCEMQCNISLYLGIFTDPWGCPHRGFPVCYRSGMTTIGPFNMWNAKTSNIPTALFHAPWSLWSGFSGVLLIVVFYVTTFTGRGYSA